MDYWKIHSTWNRFWFVDILRGVSLNDSDTDDEDMFELDYEYKNYFTFSVHFPNPPKPSYDSPPYDLSIHLI